VPGTRAFQQSSAAQVLRMQGACAEKGIPGEEEHDFFYHPVSGTHHHNQEEYIRDGMKSEAQMFSYICRAISGSGPWIVRYGIG
jgi:hypothetical protein